MSKKYLHNTTFIVERSKAHLFEEWARTVYVKSANESGRFDTVTIARVLTELDPAAVNYAIQMSSKSLEESEAWHRDVATILKDDITARLGQGQVLFFSTDMEVIL